MSVLSSPTQTQEEDMAQEEAQEKNGKPSPPYLPYRTFKNFIAGLRVGIPARIDRSVLYKLSGAYQSMLMGALRYFKLVQADGTPTNELEALVQAEAEDQKKLLRDLLKAAYPFMFGDINLQNATPKLVRDAFSKAGVSGDTIRKAEAFFLMAAKDAGVPLSQYLKVRQSGNAAKRRSATRNVDMPGEEDTREEEGLKPKARTTKSDYQMLIDVLDPEAMDDEEQKAVWTLIRYLKKQESES